MSAAHPPLPRRYEQQPSPSSYLPPRSQIDVVGSAAGGAHSPYDASSTRGNAAARPPRHRSPRGVFSLCLRLTLAAVCAVIAWQALASAMWVSARVTLARGYLADVRDITDLAVRGGGVCTSSPSWPIIFIFFFFVGVTDLKGNLMRVSFKQPRRGPRSLSPRILTHAALRHATLIPPSHPHSHDTQHARQSPKSHSSSRKDVFLFLMAKTRENQTHARARSKPKRVSRLAPNLLFL